MCANWLFFIAILKHVFAYCTTDNFLNNCLFQGKGVDRGGEGITEARREAVLHPVRREADLPSPPVPHQKR